MKGASERPKRKVWYGPIMKVRVVGVGWTRRNGYPEMVPNTTLHSEWWTQPDKNGDCFNKVPKRKSKRRFPDLPKLP